MKPKLFRSYLSYHYPLSQLIRVLVLKCPLTFILSRFISLEIQLLHKFAVFRVKCLEPCVRMQQLVYYLFVALPGQDHFDGRVNIKDFVYLCISKNAGNSLHVP